MLIYLILALCQFLSEEGVSGQLDPGIVKVTELNSQVGHGCQQNSVGQQPENSQSNVQNYCVHISNSLH